MGSICTTEKGNEDPIVTDKSDLNTTHKQLELHDAATSKAMDKLQDHEQSRPIPIEELKSGEFYDIQSKDPSPRVLGALLLEQLPNNRAKLMFLSSSDFYHFTALDTEILLGRRTLQVEIIQLYTVYPYPTFTHQPTTILQWPKQYEGEELISQISEEMRRTVREGHWVFNLPHFLEGYLHIYLSYIHNRDNYFRRTELVDLWFDFMGSYFSVLRDHILRVKLLSRETINRLLKAMEEMDQMSEMSCKSNIGTLNSSFNEKEKTLANRKNSFFDSYRPTVLSSGVFDQFWKFIMHEYHHDLAILQRQEPLSLGDLLVHLPKLTEILNHHQYFVKDLMDFAFPELHPEESLRLKLHIAAATDSFDLAEAILTQSGISSEEICLIILEEELLDPILRSSSGRMKAFVMTRTEFYPLLQAYSTSTDIPGIELFCAFQSLTARITLEDWEFVSFAIKQNIVANVCRYLDKNPEQIYPLIRRLLEVCLQHNMSSELLRNLLLCEYYGSLVFPALVEMFSHPKCRDVMIEYFRNERWYHQIYPQHQDMIIRLLKLLTARITLEDWEFVDFIAKNQILGLTTLDSFLENSEVCESVKKLVSAALDHNMSSKLLRDLLLCEYYGEFVFPALIEMFSHPKCREVMVAYFRPEAWHTDINNSRLKQRILNFLGSLAARIALENWEFVTFVIQNDTLRPAIGHSLLDNQELYENVKKIVNAALDHNMSSELLQYLLPYDEYVTFVFPALVEMFSHPKCREVMIAYIRHRQLDTVTCTPDMIIKLLKVISARIAARDWEFVNCIAQNQILRPNKQHYFLASSEVCENVKELVKIALEHSMSSELLRNLLLCEDYGEFIFPALVEKFSHPKCRDVMIAYFRHRQLNTFKCTPDMIIKLLKILTARLAVKDWEFVNFIAENQLLRPTKWHNFPEGQELYANVQVLVTVSLEHKMSPELLRNLFPWEDYGYWVFATFAKGFLRSRCFQMMISYFGSEQRCIDIAREISQYLQGEKLDVWYVFAGSVQIQFIWVRQFSQSFIKRLSPGLTREVCSYLV